MTTNSTGPEDMNNGFVDPALIAGMQSATDFSDPFGDIFMAGGQETPKGMMRVMLDGGETPQERYPRIRTTPKDRSDWIDMAYEDNWITNRGRPNEDELLEMEQLLTISEYGEARHELVQMYTRIMTPFMGPASWQKSAQRFMRRREKDQPVQG